MTRPTNEFKRFRDLTDRLLSVPKETVDRRIVEYEREREKIPRELRPGRNPKPKPSGREEA
jgi:hypothetical protein